MVDSISSSQAIAARPEPNGIAGWLMIPVILLVLTLPLRLYYFLDGLITLLDAKMRAALLASSSFLQANTAFEIIGEAVMIALSAACLVRLKQKSRKAPSLMITFFCVNFLVVLGGAALTVLYYESIGESPPSGAGRGGFGALIGVLIWTPYFIRSKRVKNTFVN